MLAAALLAALAASPSVGTKGLSTFGVKPEVGDFFTATLQQELHERGIELLVGPELGTTFVIRGTIAQLGDKTRLELELLGSDGKRLARHSAIAADAASLADQVGPLAEQLAAELHGAAPPAVAALPAEEPPEVKAEPPVATTSPEPAAPSAKPRRWWIPLLGSVVFLGGAGGCFAVAQSDHSSLVGGGHLTLPVYSYAEAQAIADHGKLFGTLGWVSLGLAAAAALTAVALWYFTGSAQ